MASVIPAIWPKRAATDDSEAALNNVFKSMPGIRMMVTVMVFADGTTRQYKMHHPDGVALKAVK